MQPDRNPDPRVREDDIYTRILLLMKIYVELRLHTLPYVTSLSLIT